MTRATVTVFGVLAAGLLSAGEAGAQSITEYPIPTASSGAGAITAGPDGALWFAEGIKQIGRIATDGTVTEFPLLAGSAVPGGIAAGPEGNLWFTESEGLNFRIGRMTTTGTVTEFPLPAGHNPGAIAAGPDGNLWFGEVVDNVHLFGMAGRMSTSGTYTDFSLEPGLVFDMAAGPDGNVWFTQPSYFHFGTFGGPVVGRITPTGQVTTFLLLGPLDIATGPDGNLWVTSQGEGSQTTFRVSRMTPQGAITGAFPLANRAEKITAGPDGALWFLQYSVNRVGRITTDGGVSSYDIPTANSGPTGITAGPDGALWFTESAANQIGRLVPQAPTPTPLPALPTPTPTPPTAPGPGTAPIPAQSALSAALLILALAAAGLWISRTP